MNTLLLCVLGLALVGAAALLYIERRILINTSDGIWFRKRWVLGLHHALVLEFTHTHACHPWYIPQLSVKVYTQWKDTSGVVWTQSVWLYARRMHDMQAPAEASELLLVLCNKVIYRKTTERLQIWAGSFNK